jgi:WD40 repeat protein
VVTLWDLATGKKLGEVTEPGGTDALGLAAGPDGKTALFTEATGGLRVLDLTAGKVVRRIDTGGLTVCAGPVHSPDRKRFAVGLPDDGPLRSEVRVYDTATGELLKTFRGHAAPVTALAFSPDGKTLASGSYDTTVLFWDVSAVGR